LARYAALCQEADIVPIVEPEVLMDGTHGIEACRDATAAVLQCVFGQLNTQGVVLEGMILKPNMILAGLDCDEQPCLSHVAAVTVGTLLRHVPAAVAGIAFLSGGQSAELASTRLNAMNEISMAAGARVPWPLVFSYGRAIQQPALAMWRGEAGNAAAAQRILAHRASCNHAALRGEYSAAMEI
jgi:fructose-bisphosphate aldolase class I